MNMTEKQAVFLKIKRSKKYFFFLSPVLRDSIFGRIYIEVKMKKISIVFIKSNTLLGKLIRKITSYPYSHVGISLSNIPDKIYSYGRYSFFNYLDGGYIEESFRRHLLLGNNLEAKFISINITDMQYEKLLEFIKNNNKGKYSKRELATTKFNRTYKKENSFICLSFVAKALKEIEVIEKDNLNGIDELEKALNNNESCNIIINNSEKHNIPWGNDKYVKFEILKELL